MFSCARGVRTLPGMHCDHVLRAFLPVFYKFIDTERVAIDWNIDL